MSKPKEYIIVNIQDISQIPEKSFDNFLTDLKHWHKAARDTVEMLETIAKAINQPVPKESITMKWTDNGKHDGKIIIKSAESKIEEK
jgi:hypothetical protein